jgi:UDP-3-O-acyl-N-acetylglucosamine deacetylase
MSIVLHEAMPATRKINPTFVVQLEFQIHFTKEVTEINFQKVTYVFEMKSYVTKLGARHVLVFLDFII